MSVGTPTAFTRVGTGLALVGQQPVESYHLVRFPGPSLREVQPEARRLDGGSRRYIARDGEGEDSPPDLVQVGHADEYMGTRSVALAAALLKKRVVFEREKGYADRPWRGRRGDRC